MAEFNLRRKEELAQKSEAHQSEPYLTSSQAYSVGAFMAVGVLDLLGYYIYQSSIPSKKNNNAVKVNPVPSVEVQTQKRANKFEME